MRVVDVGAGLCCVVKIPGSDGDHFMIYDAGNYDDKGNSAMKAIREIIPAGSDVDLLVLSHTDSDHLGAVPKICTEYVVKKIVRNGKERDTKTWGAADLAIKAEVLTGCVEVNLSKTTLKAGDTQDIGDATVTFVCGFGEPLAEWGSLDDSEELNAVSTVVRLVYKGKSILFCGDAVGRHNGGLPDQCIATEDFMVDNSELATGKIEIDSDVLVAPHHGADNGSSTRFIKAVTPKFVIFSAGHKYRHPRKVAAERYTAENVKKKNMFRTDRKDDEGPIEWDHQRVGGHKDAKGDDDVEITIKSNGRVSVANRAAD